MSHQAIAMWQWSNMIHDRVPPEMQPLRVNLDETCIRLHPERGSGFLTLSARKKKRSKASLVRHVTKRHLRGSFCHVALICDDVRLQTALPQFVFVNSALISQEDANAAIAQAPQHIRIVRVKNTWTTSERYQLIMTELSKALTHAAPTRPIVLSFDTFKAHITEECWRTAANNNLVCHLIPAKMTWALQPCDAHLFAKYKNTLSTISQRIILEEHTSCCTSLQLLRALMATIEEVMDTTSWATSFDQLGLRGNQDLVSERVLAKLCFSNRPDVPKECPSLDQLMQCFPNRHSIPLDAVFASLLKYERRMAMRSNAPVPVGVRLTNMVPRASASSSSGVIGRPLLPPLPPPATSCPPRLLPLTAMMRFRSTQSRPQMTQPRAMLRLHRLPSDLHHTGDIVSPPSR